MEAILQTLSDDDDMDIDDEQEIERPPWYRPPWRPFGSPWQKLLATVAFLDFCAAFPPPFQLLSGAPFIKLLQANDFKLGLLASILWCIEAVLIADRDCDKMLSIIENREEMKELKRTLKTGKVRPVPTAFADVSKTLAIFVLVLALQMLLLPVGFYAFVIQKYQYYQHSIANIGQPNDYDSVSLHREDMRTLLQSTYGDTKSPNNASIGLVDNPTVRRYGEDIFASGNARFPLLLGPSLELANPGYYAYADEQALPYTALAEDIVTFAEETKLSLGFAIVKHLAIALHKAAKGIFRKTLFKGARKVILQGLIWHPFRFWKQTRKIRHWIQWVMYLRPLVMAMLRLKGVLDQAYRTYQQRRRQKAAEEARRRQHAQATASQRTSTAAKQIQSTFRSYRDRQVIGKCLKEQLKADNLAAQRLQRNLKALLGRAKKHCSERDECTQRLKQLRTSRTRKQITLLRMKSKEQRELERFRWKMKQPRNPKPLKLIDQRLLMQPNSEFQETWKAIFQFCIFIELLVHILVAFQRKQFIFTRIDSMGTHQKLLQFFLPDVPAMDRPECSCMAHLVHQSQVRWGGLIVSSTAPITCRSVPWYCYPFFGQIYATTVRIFLYKISAIVAFLIFLDVPVFFFTGVHDETGALIAKPFWVRWLFPGVLQQLLINPRMGHISRIVFWILETSFHVGPVRVYRWIRILFYPALVLLFDFLEARIWVPLVSFANTTATMTGKSNRTVVAVADRRRSTIHPKRQSIDTAVPNGQRRRSTIHPKRDSLFLAATRGQGSRLKF